MKLTEIKTPSREKLFEELNKDNDTGFLTEDLVDIVRAMKSSWKVLVNEGKEKHTAPPRKGSKQIAKDSPEPKKGEVVIRTCDLFDKTYPEKIRTIPKLKQKFEDFKNAKLENPTLPVGKDAAFTSNNILRGLRHAHLTQDISVIYKISGEGNTMYLDLYGLFSHADLGTGNAPQIRTQQTMGQKLVRQRF
jgi:mRNA-degrading endonuclease YafQ of YafQ-DinJ toxin-antitoxin module